MVEKNNVWPAILISALVVLSAFFNGMYIAGVVKDSSDEPVNINLTQVASKDDIKAISDKVDNLSISNDRLNKATDEILKPEDEEKIVEDLAVEYLSDNDFLEQLAVWLEDEGVGVFDKHDLSVEVIDVDISSAGNDAYKATYKLKVFDDEDKVAKIDNIIIKVVDVDEDDEYKHAEVNEDFKSFNNDAELVIAY